MKRKHRDEVLEAPEIPSDLQIEILNRLPIKSLARFKCVSKFWSSVISSKGYLFASSPRLYISSVVGPLNCHLLSLSLASTSKSGIVFDLDSKKQGICGYNMVALRGLILYNVCERLILYNVCEHACIYNPTTGQRVTLPNILAEDEKISVYFSGSISQHVYFFGYDPVLDQYKVLCTAVGRSLKHERYTQHWVFVLEAGSSWKRVEFDHPHLLSISRQGLCINGVIYYLTYSCVSGCIVISFDVRSEEFNTIQVPSVVYEYLSSEDLGIIEYGGKPTIFDYTHLWDSSGFVILWVLEDAGKWSRKSLSLQPCQMHFFPDTISFDVIGTTQNGEVVLKPEMMSSPYYILYYDLHKNDVRRIDIRGISEEPLDLALMDTGNGKIDWNSMFRGALNAFLMT